MQLTGRKGVQGQPNPAALRNGSRKAAEFAEAERSFISLAALEEELSRVAAMWRAGRRANEQGEGKD